jgi:hypothetical protein
MTATQVGEIQNTIVEKNEKEKQAIEQSQGKRRKTL